MFAQRLVDGHDLVVCDLDGVVYLGAQAIPGAVQALGAVRGLGVRVAFATNNASRSAPEVAAHLRGLGVAAEPAEVATAAQAAAGLLAERLPSGAAVLVVGSGSLADEVAAAGLRPVLPTAPATGGGTKAEAPLAVVQGYAPEIGWSDLAEAAYAVRAGAWWVATNLDATLPTARGLAPGNGALVGAVQLAAGRPPDVSAGKPEPVLLQMAARRTGASRGLVVGDRLDTDIAAAGRAGWESLLVLTGVSDAAEAAAAWAGERPDHLGVDLGALLEPPLRVERGSEPGLLSCEGWAARAEAGAVRLIDEPPGGVADARSWLTAARVLCAAAWSAGVRSAKVPEAVWDRLGGVRPPGSSMG